MDLDALPPGMATELAGALTDFGFELQRCLPDGENVVLSPLSLWLTLLTLVPGSRGRTREELVSALVGGDAPPSEVLAGAAGALVRSLSNRKGQSWEEDAATGAWIEKPVDLFTLEIATALWAAEGYPFHEAFVKALVDDLDVEVASLDFRAAEDAADRVNGWVAERTRGRIPSIVSPDAVDPITRLLLSNATYFKAAWQDPFLPERTTPKPFHAPHGTVEAEMMRSVVDARGHFRHDALGLDVVDLPYDAMTAMLLVPDEGALAAVQNALATGLVRELRAGLRGKEVTLELPRFELGSGLEITDALPALGVREALTDRADFNGITPHPEGLVLSSVVHEARIRVDEEGTEAAAASLAAMLALGEPEAEPERVTVVADRPFLFLVLDPATGAVLFSVRVIDPTAG